MIEVEENYPTEFSCFSLLWRYDHLKVELCYNFLVHSISLVLGGSSDDGKKSWDS